jgi:hypothetical protein
MKRTVNKRQKLTTVTLTGEAEGWAGEVATVPYQAVQKDQSGKPMAPPWPVTWQSSVPAVSTIDPTSGLPVDLMEGETEITALIDGRVWA